MASTKMDFLQGQHVSASKNMPICSSLWSAHFLHRNHRSRIYDRVCLFRTLFWQNGNSVILTCVNHGLILFSCTDHRWISKSEVLMMFWEYFHKKLNSSFFVSGTAPSSLAVTRYIHLFMRSRWLQIHCEHSFSVILAKGTSIRFTNSWITSIWMPTCRVSPYSWIYWAKHWSDSSRTTWRIKYKK